MSSVALLEEQYLLEREEIRCRIHSQFHSEILPVGERCQNTLVQQMTGELQALASEYSQKIVVSPELQTEIDSAIAVGNVGLLRTAFCNCEVLLGKHHVKTLDVLSGLIDAYADDKEHQKVLQLQNDLRNRRVRLLGEHHPLTVRSLFDISVARENACDIEGSLDFAKQFVDLSKPRSGLQNEAHTFRGFARMIRLAFELFLEEEALEHVDDLQRYAEERRSSLEAMAEYRAALREAAIVLEKTTQDDDPAALQSIEDIYRRLVSAEECQDTIVSDDCALAHADLGIFIFQQPGRWREALPFLEKSVSLYSAIGLYGQQEVDPSAMSALFHLWNCLIALHSWESAVIHLRTFIQLLQNENARKMQSHSSIAEGEDEDDVDLDLDLENARICLADSLRSLGYQTEARQLYTGVLDSLQRSPVSDENLVDLLNRVRSACDALQQC
eukprot:ANDGO_07064.mRNA.1 hypothetical protein